MDKYDALIVLGKNIGVGWTRHRIRKSPHFLSDRSEFSVLAGGILFKNGNFGKIILSGGKTAGANCPSEAEAMSKFLLLKFPDFPKNKIILEDTSVDTLQNAEEVKKIADREKLKTMMVLTTPEHFARSKMLFNKEGMNVEMVSSGETLKKYAPELFEKYKYKTNQFEVFIEKAAYGVQLIPYVGDFAHKLVSKSRSKK